MLLDYCLSDLPLLSPPSPTTAPTQSPKGKGKETAAPTNPSKGPVSPVAASPAVFKAIAELDGLPLLPLQNGLGVLRSAKSAQQQQQQQQPHTYVLPGPADLDVLAPVPGLCLSPSTLTDGLQAQLLVLADQGESLRL